MQRALVVLAIGVATVMAPAAAMAQTMDHPAGVESGPNQGIDMPPAYLQAPPYLQGNAQGDGNGQ
jgi:hypothetical protein